MSYKRARGVRRVVSATVRTGAAGPHLGGSEGTENNQDILIWDLGRWDDHGWAYGEAEPLEWDAGQWDVNYWDSEKTPWIGYWDVAAWDDFMWE